MWFLKDLINCLEMSAMYTKNWEKVLELWSQILVWCLILLALYVGWGWGLQSEETQAICRYCPFPFSFWVPFLRLVSKNMQINGSVCFTSVGPPWRSIIWDSVTSEFLFKSTKGAALFGTLAVVVPQNFFNFYIYQYTGFYKKKGTDSI